MRFTPLLFLILALTIPVHAQTYEITATGTVTNGFGNYSSISAGAVYTMTETFHLATATLTLSSGTSATYVDPDGTSSFTFDGTTLTGSAPEIQITSGALAGDTPVYGFQFSQSLASGGYTVELISVNSSDAPSTSLTSLNSLETAPFSDFENSLNLSTYNDGVGDDVSGRSTSISVEEVAAPEPSSFVMVAGGVALFLCLRRCHLRKRNVS